MEAQPPKTQAEIHIEVARHAFATQLLQIAAHSSRTEAGPVIEDGYLQGISDALVAIAGTRGAYAALTRAADRLLAKGDEASQTGVLSNGEKGFSATARGDENAESEEAKKRDEDGQRRDGPQDGAPDGEPHPS